MQYRFNKTDLSNMVSEFEALETSLSASVGQVSIESAGTAFKWTGQAANDFRTDINTFETEGDYYLADGVIKGVSNCLGIAIEGLNPLLSEQEQIGSNLDSGIAVDGLSNEINLSPSGLANFKSNVDLVLNQNSLIKGNLMNIMSRGGNIIDFSSNRTALVSASAKVRRLDAYRTALSSWATKVRDLDNELDSNLSRWISVDHAATAIDLDTSEEYLALLERLNDNDMTLEEYNCAILDTFMYIDMFDGIQDDDGNVILTWDEISEYKRKALEDGDLTLKELLVEIRTEILGDVNEDEKTGCRYIDIVWEAVRNDSSLANMQIKYCSRLIKDEDGNYIYNEGTNGIVFQDSETDAIYVAYRGTSGKEWVDDAERLGVTSMDRSTWTQQMQQTVSFFEYVGDQMNWTDDDTIIVTGHSQGGNDAQISTILSKYGDIVDACYSMDGEGHSPELIEACKEYWGDKWDGIIDNMYAINGYDDPVHNLGQVIILPDHTTQIRCETNGNFANVHDIAGIFGVYDSSSDKIEYTYMLNETEEGESYLANIAAEIWDELDELPLEQRGECAIALLQLVQIGYGKEPVCIDGNIADIDDYETLLAEGVNVIVSGLGKATLQEIQKKVYEISGGNEYINSAFDIAISAYDLYSDIEREKNYIKRSIIFKGYNIVGTDFYNSAKIIGGGLSSIGEDLYNGGVGICNTLSNAAREDMANTAYLFATKDFDTYLKEEVQLFGNTSSELAGELATTFWSAGEEAVGMTVDFVEQQIDTIKSIPGEVSELAGDIGDSIVSSANSVIDDVKNLWPF